ncbi:MAG TPA: hypothetical protein VHZ97_04975 [Pseudonocardiaceae bacterium]|nr:hypothetical protein [Pseudonocardiaceae bacterium]
MDSALVHRCHYALEPIAVFSFIAPETGEYLVKTGLRPGRMCLLAGRAVPLGRAGAALVTATFYSTAPSLIAKYFPSTWALADPAEVLAARFAAADIAFRRVLGPEIIESPELAELAELARAAAEAGSPAGRPLYAAYADVEWPAEPHLVLWHAAATLREHRGDGHVASLLNAELSGLAASITHAGAGTGYPSDLIRRNRGWSEQQWAEGIADLADQGIVDADGQLTVTGTALRQQIEADTDRLATGPWAHLGADRTQRVLDLAAPIRAAVLATGLFPPGMFD